MSGSSQVVEIDDIEKTQLVDTRVTCPFLGAAINERKLAVRNEFAHPLASIEDVRALGNSGGGDLGDLLAFFASGNHALMRGDSGKLDKPVPAGLFSLELPGSQGSHPGHSGILQGDPTLPGSGRFSAADFARLTNRAIDGWIKRADVGRFIAENLAKDPTVKVAWVATGALLSGVIDLMQSTGSALVSKLFASDEEADAAHRKFEQDLTKVLGSDNLAGSAGEFGLLFAFLASKPGAREVDGEPVLAVVDLVTMFVHKQMPVGWETWKKSRIDWVKHTTALLISARREYRSLK